MPNLTPAQLRAATRQSKYRNVPTVVDGVRFASKKEAKRYGELKLMQRAGAITHLDVHPSWEFTLLGVRIGKYTADFSYRRGAYEFIVEDVKGGKATRTEAYKLRKALMLAIHGIKITEI